MKVTIKTKFQLEDIVLNNIDIKPMESLFIFEGEKMPKQLKDVVYTNEKYMSFFDKNGKVKYMIDRDYILSILWEEE